MLTNVEKVIDLENQVIDLAERLKRATAAWADGAGDDVRRDYFGTLHVNLCALARAAERAAKDLEKRHGFTR